MQTKTSPTFHATDDADIDAMFDTHDGAAARDSGRGRRRGPAHAQPAGDRRADARRRPAHRPRTRKPVAAGEHARDGSTPSVTRQQHRPASAART